jgi:uncharacterized protein YcfJ
MKTKLRLLSLSTMIGLSASLATPAFADRYRDYGYDDDQVEQQVRYDYARVVAAKPIYERVEVDVGREVCRNEQVRYAQPSREYRPRSNAAPVVGLIIGGLIGNQFGHDRGRAAATVAGAALGSAIAEDSENQRRYYGHNGGGRNDRGRTVTSTERVCEYRPQYQTRNELVGYDVTYDYKGQIGHTQTQSQPGNTIRVEVAVTVVED